MKLALNINLALSATLHVGCFRLNVDPRTGDLNLPQSTYIELLEQLSRGATRITLADNVPTELNLRRIALAPPR